MPYKSPWYKMVKTSCKKNSHIHKIQQIKDNESLALTVWQISAVN